MAKPTMYDRLRMVAPPSVVAAGSVVDTVDDLQRILSLPRRSPVVCDVDKITKKYPPATQALVEVETAKFSRGDRISCACRPRNVQLHADGQTLTIFRVLPERMSPEPPIHTTRSEFFADNKTPGDEDAHRAVLAMQPGTEIALPSADGSESGHPCIIELAPPQAWFLREAAQEGGVVGHLGVGSGKSICFLLAALLFPDSRLAVLMIEPKQRQHYRSQYLRLREHFRVTSIVCDAGIRGSTVPGTTPLHLISYSVLSRTDNSDMLDRLLPDVLMLDEGHRVCGTSAANRRTKSYETSRIKAREEALLRGEKVRARAVNLLVASGTLEVKSVNDTQMLCAYALGTGSPLPLDLNEAESWSFVFDAAHNPDRKSLTAQKLHRAFGKGLYRDPNEVILIDRPEKALREGFQKWRTHTPGVITASASDINASIKIDELETPKMPKVIKEALARVRVDNLRPDGAELVEVVEQLACAKNVSSGFFAYWAFPKHPCKCEKDAQGSVVGLPCSECSLIEDWYRKRKAYSKDNRSILLRGMTHLDSDKNCENAAERARKWGEKVKSSSGKPLGFNAYCYTCLCAKESKEVIWPCIDPSTGRITAGHLPAWHAESWSDWREIKDKVEYDERVKWLGHGTPEAADPATHPGYFLARFIADYAKKNKCVVWFQSVPLGRKIAELSGLPYFNGGPGGEDRLRAEKGNRSVICSISAHGSGTDGLQQIFDEQVIVEPPPSNSTTHGLEQILGRLHRRGQPSDEVRTRLCLHAYEFKDAFRKAIQQANWNFEMEKKTQKLLLADIAIDDL